MNAENKITIKSVTLDDIALPAVIYDAIGNPSSKKVLEVVGSYKYPDHAMIGAFIGNTLVGVLGSYKTNEVITIRHISVLINYRRQGIGTLLLNRIKQSYKCCKILAETDEESVNFYIKLGFTCHAFNGQYGNLRYKCEFNSKF